ncbi:MAG: methylenetetrahydrofolate--tRNA-(uracil(54)-C(5))-methyltransferase (FADH(2)-oxidizing) TrmFO [Deltaproteobacteria bacterium]|nr:methylenetetrahydrofolate--tRNA-(uracil(54)-C(5))-methyltransferase (FADH(2)-oxidizing) TrmFO [Deltaproteobacteria bacterium]
MTVRIIGAGLAGCEAAWQLLRVGISVDLFEMRPDQMTPAHKTGSFAELVCSNSLGSADLANATGLLKAELKSLNSLVIAAAEHASLPAGGALAVDHSHFSGFIEEQLRAYSTLRVIRQEIKAIPEVSPHHPLLIASGPLTSEALATEIKKLSGEDGLSFFDAISPILTLESIDQSQVFRGSRYGKGGGADYINVPMDKECYYRFVELLLGAEKFVHHLQDELSPKEGLKPFEGCMPIEDMAERGIDSLLYGPLKPTGLINPSSGKRPFAVLQLRQDDQAGGLWNMVGMQTRMKRPEQERIFRSLPGLERAEFARFGSVHRNTFINSPKLLDPHQQFKSKPGLFFAGQITGVEGYVESCASGLAAGIQLARLIQGQAPIVFPVQTAIGALLSYITDPVREDFQPMNINFGLMPSYLTRPVYGPNGKRLSKRERRLQTSHEALDEIRLISGQLESF